MVLSDLAVKRPVLATVASLLIVVVGAASLLRLPVREYPNVDKPVVTVTTTYTGAAPEIVATEVTEVIEGAISGVDGVDRIESSSREGRSRTVIEFGSSRNVDAAANDVREAVSRVLGDLPEEANQPEVVKADADAQPVLRLALTSERLSPAELTDLAERTIVERLSTVAGVGQVEVYGERRHAIRVWLDRRALAARELVVGDVEAALRRSNVELPSGTLEAPDRQFTVRTESRLSTPEQFRDIVVGRVGDYPIRLGEVARVERGVEDDSTIVRAQGASAIGLGVLRQSEANTIAVSNDVRAQLESIRPLLPDGVSLDVTSDDATFIEASIQEVVKALLLAVGLVVLVIFLFLGSIRATLIPAVTIPVSIVGTFTLLAAFGFSINVLTLLALLLAIGLVVDDAIVVLENVQRRVDGGEPPLLGAYLGTRQVTFAVLGTSLALVAVFVPISFIPGDIGRLFAEFGIALASAVALSTFVALSLTPMLCARMIRPVGGGWLVGGIGRAINRLARWYRAVLVRALGAPVLVLGIAGGVAALAALLFVGLPQELVPQEDRGGFFVSSSAPEGATIEATDRGARKVDAVLQPLLGKGEATRILTIVGFRNQPNRAFTIVGLSDYGARERGQMAIVDSLRGPLSAIPDVRAVPINRSGLGSSSGSQGVQFIVGGPDYADVEDWVDRIIARARQNPNLADVDTDYAKTRPQLSVTIDRPKAEDLGISAEDIAATLQTMLASRQVTSYVDRSRSYEVILQARDRDRREPADLENIFMRAASGALVPLSALVTTKMAAAPPDLERFDRLPSIEIDASLVGDYDLGAAIAYFDEIAAEELPVEARTSFDGAAREFQRTSNGLYVTFGLALLVVFLVLAAIFESFVHPLIIMLSVPLAVSAAFASLVLVGGSLNIYSQIGIIMLVGLTAKNGILIVEFANQLRDEGRSVRDAILEGSVLRLRPILMTVASTILGAVPLAIASGAGAESRSAIGIVVIGGLGVASVLTLFVTPVLYDLLARFTRPAGAVAVDLDRAMAGARQPAE
ncbi:MAG: efflux RND transporter permease subunit [Geminicoccaceae bacterium]|nr:efflux RND transporter permease subunit [Geminicoccaceae bacterium]